MTLSSFRALLFFAIVVAVYAVPRRCLVCTFINEDFTVRSCQMCETLLPSHGDGAPKSLPAASSTRSLPPGHHACGWRLDDGSICPYSSSLMHNITRHRADFAAHSKQRAAEGARDKSAGATGLFSMLKRPRLDDAEPTPCSSTAAGATSSTRTPASSPMEPPLCAASSSKAPSSSGSATFAQFACPPQDPATKYKPFTPSAPDSSNSSSAQEPFNCFEHEEPARERFEQQQASHYQESAKLEGVQLMASMAQAAAQAATAALAEQVVALTSQLEGLPQAIAREVPAAVRDHDEAEALRLSNDALESSLQKQIAASATCTEIGKLTGFTYNATENTITCLDCFRYASSPHAPGLLRRGARDAGIFKGVDQTRHEPKGRERQGREKRPMKTVRYEVKHHCRAGSLHEWCVVYADEQRKATAKSIAVGMVCANLVYLGIKEHDSYQSYERRIANQYSIGTAVGSKNHSREFARGFTNSIYMTTIDCLTSALTSLDAATASALAPDGRAPPIAPLADKATVQRRTGQMHGTITFLAGEIVALFTSVLIVTDSTGDGLAALQVSTYTEGKPLKLSPEALRIQMTGQAYDGQYQGEEQGNVTGLDVPRHFCRRLHLNPKWTMSKWDRAHKIELGMKNVREGKDSPPSTAFYGKLAATVSDSLTPYLYGKGHERVLQGWAKLKKRMLSIGTICTTRFCASERKVFKNYASNLVFIIIDMETVRASETGITQQVLQIKTITFVVHLFGVIDLERPLKDLSLALQAV